MGVFMFRFLGILSVLSLFVVNATGCAGQPGDASAQSLADDQVAADPNAVSRDILDFIDQHGWPDHHVMWHSVRNWAEGTRRADVWIKWMKKGWKPAEHQEGTPGNGLDF